MLTKSKAPIDLPRKFVSTIHMPHEHLKFAILASDVALFTLKEDALYVRMMRVNRPPHFHNAPGLLGGLILPKETAEEATERLVEAKGGIRASRIYIEQLATFSAINRDPRGRVIAVAYMALASWESLSPEEQKDTLALWWQPLSKVPRLAYDHNEILRTARERLCAKSQYTSIVQKLLPKTFTLSELERAEELLAGRPIDKRNFRKKLAKLGLLTPTGERTEGSAHRPAALYRFKSQTVAHTELL